MTSTQGEHPRQAQEVPIQDEASHVPAAAKPLAIYLWLGGRRDGLRGREWAAAATAQVPAHAGDRESERDASQADGQDARRWQQRTGCGGRPGDESVRGRKRAAIAPTSNGTATAKRNSSRDMRIGRIVIPIASSSVSTIMMPRNR